MQAEAGIFAASIVQILVSIVLKGKITVTIETIIGIQFIIFVEKINIDLPANA